MKEITMRFRPLIGAALLVLAGAAAVSAQLAQLPSGPVWALLATVVLAVVSTTFTDYLARSWTAALQGHKTRLDALAAGCLRDQRGRLPKIRSLRDLLPLGVRPARHDGTDARSGVPAYVARDADPDLDAALRAGGLVVLTGPAGCGKTRMAYEAVRRVFPDRLLVAPRESSVLPRMADRLPLRQMVIWLDRLDRFFGDDGLALYELHHACATGNRRGVVIATLLHDDPGRPDRSRYPELVGKVLDLATVIPVEASWSSTELTRARVAAEDDPALAAAVRALPAGRELLAHVVGKGGTAQPATATDVRPTGFRPEPVLRWRLAVPSRPPCVDRETEVGEVVAGICAEPPRPVLVLGAPGIGKTTVVRTALHDHRVVARFGPRRMFVRCKGPIVRRP